MLGMRRPPPPPSLDDLELERSAAASKVRKDDALSIYEATLQKLRRGSRRAFCESQSSNAEATASEGSASTSCVCKLDGNNPQPMEIDQQN